MTQTPTPTGSALRRGLHDARFAAALTGALLITLGVLGLIPGVTSDYSDMQLAGPGSTAKLLGVFQVSILHSLVHIVAGTVGLFMARSTINSRRFLLLGGTFYLILWLYGVLTSGSDANFLPVNSAGMWLHISISIIMIVLGAVFSRQAPDRSSRTSVD